jgi:hypothetical protein
MEKPSLKTNGFPELAVFRRGGNAFARAGACRDAGRAKNGLPDHRRQAVSHSHYTTVRRTSTLPRVAFE